MPSTYFDRNQNLQVNGDITFISNGGPSQDDHSFLYVTQQVEATKVQSLAVERGYKILCENTAPSALYGYGHSFTGPKCHPGTRIAVQDYIFKWLDDPDGQIAMWMNGPVGIGKSAIAQTIAHLAAEREQLSSAFFFFRSDNARNNAKQLVPTLAYAMTQQMPHTLNHVCQTVAAHPLIFSSSLDHQIGSVLLQSLRTQSELSPRAHKLIIIDGLDECHDTNTQQAIVRSFISNLLSPPMHIIPHKLLIVSRPESHISSAFSLSDICPHVNHFSLATWDTEDDIEILLRDKLKEIKDTHPMRHHLPDIWPDEDSYRRLRERSVGSFAYASCVLRFLASHKHDPNRALKDILYLQTHRSQAAFTDLDALYLHILSSLDPDICFTLQKILYLRIFFAAYGVFDLAVGLWEERSAVEVAIIHVPSLIHFDGQSIFFHHTSFEEFLRDKGRSGEFHIFSSHLGAAVATALSNMWLHPIGDHDEHKNVWFHYLSTNMYHHDGPQTNKFDSDINKHILRRLVATKIPANIFTAKALRSVPNVTHFFRAVQMQFIRSSESTYEPLYNEAYNTVCVWVRSQLNVLSRGQGALRAMLNILWRYNSATDSDSFFDLIGLLIQEHKPIDFLCRLFPEMDCVEVCNGIVEFYLALSAQSRLFDVEYYSKWGNFISNGRVNISRLYAFTLVLHDAMAPKLCHQVERLVLDGQAALHIMASYGPGNVRTSKRCIYRSLSGQDLINGDWEFGKWTEIVESTDRYIRQAHAKLDFPYISEDVEALYRLQFSKSAYSYWN